MEYFHNIWNLIKPQQSKFRRSVVGQFIIFFILGITICDVVLVGLNVVFRTDRKENVPINLSIWEKIDKQSKPFPLVYVVTPTVRNPNQLAELTRTAQALYPSRAFVHWLIWEDSEKTKGRYPKHTQVLKDYLHKYFPNISSEVKWSTPKTGSEFIKFNPKGVEARRDAIQYIRNKFKKGVLYFADDDNAYDCQIFKKIQRTKKVSVWPVGAVTVFGVSSPVVNSSIKVVDFYDGFRVNRLFPLDFAGFSLNSRILLKNPTGNIPWIAGYQESTLLRTLNTTLKDLHPICSYATEVLAWHTKTLRIGFLSRTRLSIKQANRLSLTNIRYLFKKYRFRRYQVDLKPRSSSTPIPLTGWLTITIVFQIFGINQERNANLSPIVPFSIYMSPPISTWTGLSKEISLAYNNKSFLYIVTPTYCRSTQLAELTRLAQAIYPFAKHIKWLIYDDVDACPDFFIRSTLQNLIKPFKLNVRIRQAGKPQKKNSKRRSSVLGKGFVARSTAIEHLRDINAYGVLYFADDDNTYDSQLFYQMLKKITIGGCWPVGTMYRDTVSTPVVRTEDGLIDDFYDGFTFNRKFPMDFAGFAINLDVLHQVPHFGMRPSPNGYMETYFLADLQLNLNEFTPLADKCTKVLSWHTLSLGGSTALGRKFQQSSNFVKDFFDVVLTGNIILEPALQTSNIPSLYTKYFSHVKK